MNLVFQEEVRAKNIDVEVSGTQMIFDAMDDGTQRREGLRSESAVGEEPAQETEERPFREEKQEKILFSFEIGGENVSKKEWSTVADVAES